MGLDTNDYKLFKEVAKSLEDHNELVAEQNRILLEILQQMKYLR